MSKVLVDRELLERVAALLEWDGMDDTTPLEFGAKCDSLCKELSDYIAQTAEAEGVVAWAPSTALEKLRNRHNNAPCMLTDGPAEFNDVPLVPLAALSAVTAERDRLQQFEAAYNEWHDKTEWVQETANAHELGKHRADVLKDRVDQLQAEVERLRNELAGKPLVC